MYKCELLVCFYFSPEKASAVLAPLLTPQAIELLENCLSSKESEVWKLLGPNWIYPKYVNVRFLNIIPITGGSMGGAQAPP